MAKKSDRSPVSLNLTPELPEVVSRDFNLFYEPKPQPLPAGVKEFASALDNFVKTGGTKAVLMAEQEEKTINSVQAEQEYNENKLAFHDAIKAGKITPEANPYYLNKYKELTLKSFANEFRDELDRLYVESDIKTDITAGSFDNWYKGVITDFVKKKNINAFSPLDLEKNFFQETSKARNQLDNEHRQTQLKIFNEKFDEMLVNNLYGSIADKKKDILKGNATYEDLGNIFKEQFDDIRAVNPNVNTTDLFIRTMRAYVKQTRDYDFSFKLIDNLPSFIKGGTNTIANTGKIIALKDELISELQSKKLQKTQIDNAVFEADKTNKFHNYYNTLDQQYKNNPNFLSEGLLDIDRNSLNAEERKALDNFKEVYATGFKGGKETDPTIIDKVQTLIKKGEYEPARTLIHNGWLNRNVSEADHNLYMTKIIPNEQRGIHKTGFNHPEFQDYLKVLESSIQGTGTAQDKRRAYEIKSFVLQHMQIWSAENENTFSNTTEKSKAFIKEFKEISRDLGKTGMGGAGIFGIEYPSYEDTMSKIRTRKLELQQQNQPPNKNTLTMPQDGIVSGVEQQRQKVQKKADELIQKERAKNQNQK